MDGRSPKRAGGRRSMAERERTYGGLADMVREARRGRGMTQRQLSLALGMSQGYVGHLEIGRFRPTVETLKALASVLGLLYGALAVEAGYITAEEYENPLEDEQLARLHEVSDLTDDEWESVRDFARYVRSTRRGRQA